MLESFSSLTIGEVRQSVQKNHQLLTGANEHRVFKTAVLAKESHESYESWLIHPGSSQEATGILSIHQFVIVHLTSEQRVVLRNRFSAPSSKVSKDSRDESKNVDSHLAKSDMLRRVKDCDQ